MIGRWKQDPIMVPVVVALIGSRLHASTVAFHPHPPHRLTRRASPAARIVRAAQRAVPGDAVTRPLACAASMVRASYE